MGEDPLNSAPTALACELCGATFIQEALSSLSNTVQDAALSLR